MVVLPLVCLLSGAAGLIFETVWFHRASLVFGGSVWSTTLVLSSFMGGLGIGSAVAGRAGTRVSRPLLAYSAAELTVAVSGIVLTHVLPRVTEAVALLAGRT